MLLSAGVWQAGQGEVGAAVSTALKAGYRHIDGAWIYGVCSIFEWSDCSSWLTLQAHQNEAEVGQALKESGVPRHEVWLTSKVLLSLPQR